MLTRQYHDHEVARGGKNFYGIPVGMLMLDGRFPRIPGDAGNATTWPFPVLYHVVRNADPDRIVRRLNPEDWLQPFIDGAQELERAGVELITTSCGFLVLFQHELQQCLNVPLLTSSLMQIPWITSMLPPGRSVGVLTIEERSLSARHLSAAGIQEELPVVIQGLDEVGGYFSGQLLENRSELDIERCEAEHERAARALLDRDPSIGAIVLECTNMSPYAHRIRAVTNLPVYDITTLLQWAASGILRRPFCGYL